MLVIGLTGGIASGKTLVSDSFAELGAPIVDADLIAREVVAPGSDGLQGLTQQFGNDILNESGDLNRSVLRDIIFKDTSARKKVDALLHPLIRTVSEQRIAEHRMQKPAYVIHAIPLLVETGQSDRFNRIAVVDVPVSMQLMRLMSRDNTTAESAQRIIGSQASRDERLAVADDVIDNSGSIESTKAQVTALHEQYKNLSQHK